MKGKLAREPFRWLVQVDHVTTSLSMTLDMIRVMEMGLKSTGWEGWGTLGIREIY